MTKWYVNINGQYHITRTNIADCQCLCGKKLVTGMELEVGQPRPDRICLTCFSQYNPAPVGGPMSLPHYLEGENERLRAENAELRAKLQEMPA